MGRSTDATSAEGTHNTTDNNTALLGNAPTTAEPRRQHPDSSVTECEEGEEGGEGDGSSGEHATSTGCSPSSAAAAPRIASCVESAPSPGPRQSVGPLSDASSDGATAAAGTDGALRLSGGWQQFVCAASGKPYYWNDATDVTQWERPTLLEPPARQPDALGGEAASGSGGAASPLRAKEGSATSAAMASSAPSDDDAPDDAPGEMERLRREVAALKRALADHEIERHMLNQQCDLLARQNDRLIQQRDDAIAEAELERAAARARSAPATPPEGSDGEAGGNLYHGVHACVDVD